VSCYGTSDGQILLQVQTGPVDLLLADAFGTPLATISNATAGDHLFDQLGAGNYLLGFAGATGCGTVWETIAVAEPFPLEANVVTNLTSCPGTADGMVVLQVLGGTLPYSISWNSGHVGDTLVAAGGSYLATISDAEGCSMEVEATIDTPDGPFAFFTVPEEDILAGQSVTFQNGSTAGSSYLWNMGDGSIIEGPEAVHTYLVPGSYTVVLEASLGTCTDTHAENVLVQVTTGVGGADSDPRIWSDGDRVWIDALGQAGPWHVEVLDVTGRLLSMHGPVNGSDPTAIPMPRHAGVILVRLTGNGGSTVHRMVPFMAPR
jgi:PKD repeat protein